MPEKRNIQNGYAFNSRKGFATSPDRLFMNPITSGLYLLMLMFVITITSCGSDNDDGIPAYIHIEQIGLTTLPAQGTASHNITDAWVYINGKLIGAFELPATFPVLKKGEHQVSIQAGIKINGISATRSAYPFFTPIVTMLNLIPGEVSTVTDTMVAYRENTTFVWMEDFNGGALTIDTTSNSKAPLQRTSDPGLVFNYMNELNQYSGMASLSDDVLFFECATINSYELPKGGRPVFLELNYRNDHNLTIGMFMSTPNETLQQAILILNPSEAWNKVYVNLTPTISNFADAENFRIFFGLLRAPDSDPVNIYFDHFKLLH